MGERLRREAYTPEPFDQDSPGNDESTGISDLIVGAESNVGPGPELRPGVDRGRRSRCQLGTSLRRRPIRGPIPNSSLASSWHLGRPGRTTALARAASRAPQPVPGVPIPASWARQLNPPPPGLLGEDEELIAGRHPVEEAFIARRKAVRLLVVPSVARLSRSSSCTQPTCASPIIEVEGGTLTSLAGFDGHQGIALVTDKRQFAGLNDILARAIERKEAPVRAVLDSLEDPQKLRRPLRTAEASGVHGVIYPTHRQAPLSPAAIKSSAGAVEHLLLVPVDDLAEALTDLHIRGLRVVGSDADASQRPAGRSSRAGGDRRR